MNTLCCCGQHEPLGMSCGQCPVHSDLYAGGIFSEKPVPPETTKPTNPKEAFGNTKPYISTVPWPFVFGIGSAMVEGAAKYGRHNYRIVGVKASTYIDAADRHLKAYWEGQDIDPDSGLHHLVKAGACLAVVYDSIVQGNLNDDRPPKSPDGWLEKEAENVKRILAKYPEPKEPLTEKGKKK